MPARATFSGVTPGTFCVHGGVVHFRSILGNRGERDPTVDVGGLWSVVKLLGTEMAVPDHTTVSRRAMSLPSIAELQVPNGPLHVLIDSTGLKVYGAGEWLVEKHGQT